MGLDGIGEKTRALCESLPRVGKPEHSPRIMYPPYFHWIMRSSSSNYSGSNVQEIRRRHYLLTSRSCALGEDDPSQNHMRSTYAPTLWRHQHANEKHNYKVQVLEDERKMLLFTFIAAKLTNKSEYPTALFMLFCSQIKVSVLVTVKKLPWGLLAVM